MSDYWRSPPSPAWASVWLVILPPVNLFTFVRLLIYARLVERSERDEHYRLCWLIVALSALMSLIVALSLIGLVLLLQSNDHLLPDALRPYF